MSEHRCPKCKGNMTAGFIIDHGHYNSASQAEWSQGTGEQGFWTGLKTARLRKVTTYGCDDCGFLESYVNQT